MAGSQFLPPLPQRAQRRIRVQFSLSRLLIVFVLVGPLLVAARHVMGRDDFWQLIALVSSVAFCAALIMLTAGFAWRVPLDVLAFCTAASALVWFASLMVGYRCVGIVQHAMDALISPRAQHRGDLGTDLGVLLTFGAGGCVVAGLVVGFFFALAEERQQ